MTSDASKTETTTPPPAAPAPAVAAAAPTASDTIDYETFKKVELKVGVVRVAEPVKKSKKLLRLEIDLGEPTLRQIVAGIAEVYPPEKLIGRQVVVVANLAPAKLMGVESRGMVLAADTATGPAVLLPEREVLPGAGVR
jgi:methionyl-tRNA synthetase